MPPNALRECGSASPLLPRAPPPRPAQAYKLRQVQSTHIKPESGRLMLVLHVRRGGAGRGGAAPCWARAMPASCTRAPHHLPQPLKGPPSPLTTTPPPQDVSSPIPADHISNTNPLVGGAPLPPPAAAELLELQTKLAYHARRLFRHEARCCCRGRGKGRGRGRERERQRVPQRDHRRRCPPAQL